MKILALMAWLAKIKGNMENFYSVKFKFMPKKSTNLNDFKNLKPLNSKFPKIFTFNDFF